MAVGAVAAQVTLGLSVCKCLDFQIRYQCVTYADTTWIFFAWDWRMVTLRYYNDSTPSCISSMTASAWKTLSSC